MGFIAPTLMRWFDPTRMRYFPADATMRSQTFARCLLLGLLASVSESGSTKAWTPKTLPAEGWPKDHVIAVNTRAWPDEALFTPAQLLEATQRYIGKLSPETFVLYEADIEEGKASHGMWPKGAVALVSTTHHGYLPYTHGLQSSSNVSSAGLALARFAALALSVGDPAHVHVVQSGDDLMDLVDSADPPRPVLVLFSSFTSAQTARMRPFFEAAAGLYERQIPFADVRCAGKGSNTALAALCRRHNITAYPTLGLFTGDEWIPFDVYGSARTPGDIELFLWRHRRRFPSVRWANAGAANEDAALDETEKQSDGDSATLAGNGDVASVLTTKARAGAGHAPASRSAPEPTHRRAYAELESAPAPSGGCACAGSIELLQRQLADLTDRVRRLENRAA